MNNRRIIIAAIMCLLYTPALWAQDARAWVPKVQILDSNGDPLASGKVYTYVAGTTTNQSSYTDSTKGTANANPVVLDSAGRANIWLDEALSYRIDVKDSSDVLVYSVDNISEQFVFVGATLTVGTGAEADAKIVFDGNAGDFYWGLDDSSDKMVGGVGSVVGTTPAITIDSDQQVHFDLENSATMTLDGAHAHGYLIDVAHNKSGAVSLRVENLNGSTGAFASISAANEGEPDGNVGLYALGRSYTSSGSAVQDGALLEADDTLSGGLGLSSDHASGTITFYIAQTKVLKIDTDGHLDVGAMDAPAVSSCGTSPSISGTDQAGTVTIGSGSVSSCTVTFDSAYDNAPSCVVSNATAVLLGSATTTTTLTITGTSIETDVIHYQCMGL